MNQASPGSNVKVRAALFNGKVGHYIPSGSCEERMLWLEMTAIDAEGKTYYLTLNKKGFKGEEYTISDEKAFAYQAMGEMMGVKEFGGLKERWEYSGWSKDFQKTLF